MLYLPKFKQTFHNIEHKDTTQGGQWGKYKT